MSGGSHISHIPDVEAERPLHDVGGEVHIAKRRMQTVSLAPVYGFYAMRALDCMRAWAHELLL
jgi:hypothetical protein